MKKKIKELYQKSPNWVKNGYFVSAIIFVIWILFFDTNSILKNIERENKINQLKTDIEYYKTEIKKDKALINVISQDSLTEDLEKYFREQLLLSKKNEEIFIVE
ncbi:MAG: septum formation initiator [Flavobacteriales bacterium]|nr:septum formation initiator [Flavobacteriales bacterium]|tara:strand:+ start:567 stop:878 length:312 start_codon:yes stop_codon:yes gene_type:complete